MPAINTDGDSLQKCNDLFAAPYKERIAEPEAAIEELIDAPYNGMSLDDVVVELSKLIGPRPVKSGMGRRQKK